MKTSSGRERLYGRPGYPGPYQDLPRSKAGATEAEQRAIRGALLGEPEGAPAPKEMPKTIRQHAETFVDTYKPGSKPSEKREKRRVLKSDLLPHFGNMTIEAMKQADVDTFAASELKRGMAIKTVNNRLAVLSTLIKYVTGEKSRLRFKLDGMTGELTAVAMSDVEKMIATTDDQRYRVLVLLASEAGLRAGEIRGLHWTDMLTNEVIAPKHNKTRTVPLSPRLVSALAELPRRGVWVIAEEDGSYVTYDRMSETVNALYVRAGVARPPKPIHCLRHTFGTVMAQRVQLPVLQTLMGHSDVVRYIDVNAVGGTEWHSNSGRRGATP